MLGPRIARTGLLIAARFDLHQLWLKRVKIIITRGGHTSFEYPVAGPGAGSGAGGHPGGDQGVDQGVSICGSSSCRCTPRYIREKH